MADDKTAGTETGMNPALAGMTELSRACILLVDDQPIIRTVVEKILTDSGAVVHYAQSIADARQITAKVRFNAAIVDIMLSDENGLDLIAHLRSADPGIAVVVITGFADQAMAESLEEAGVHAVLTKPFSASQLRFTLCKELVRRRTVTDGGAAGADGADAGETGLIGESPYMRDLRRRVGMLAKGDIPVLIQGPTGTGKEIVARAVHTLSRRRNREMMIVNSSAIPEHLEESEFFGHTRGAFTGAHENKAGIVMCADGSTLFLDEVGDLSLRMQAKLLRVLDGHEFFRVGETVPQRSDFRLVSATNRPLDEMIQAGSFREDLFYRLKSGLITTLPLSSHCEDIPALVRHFLLLTERKANRAFLIAGGAMELLTAHEWPGNIRELRNTVSTLCNNSNRTGLITPENVAAVIGGKPADAGAGIVTFAEAKAAFEKNYFKTLMQKHGGNISKCAQEAGIERAYLSKRFKSLGMDPASFKIIDR